MKCAILIGFMYKYDIRYTNLPGCIIDLYKTYQLVKKYKYDKIIVITDLKEDIIINYLKDAILSGEIDFNICSFLSNLNKEKQLYIFNSNDTNDDNSIKNDNIYNIFIKNIKNKVLDASFIYLYYTGHATINKLCLPYIDKIYTNIFFNDFSKYLNEKAQILFIFDCCHGNNFGLPFNLKNNGNFKLNNLKNDNILYLKNEIICIMSSNEYEQSYTYDVFKGSPFTSIFINSLDKNYKTWLELKNNMQMELDKILKGKQNINIYSNYNSSHYIWYWINSDNKIKINYYTKNNYLILENLK